MLIALGQAKRTFRLNLLMAPQLLLYPVIGVSIAGGTGAVCGFIVANWIMVPFWYRLLSRSAKEAEQDSIASRARRGDPEQDGRPRGDGGSGGGSSRHR